MPELTLPIGPDGMTLSAILGLNQQDSLALLQAGQPMPRPLQLSALIDSGCSVTAVAPHVFRRLGLAPLVAGSTLTAAGPIPVQLYRISLSLFDLSGHSLLTLPDLLVSELTSPLMSFDLLLGMDVLLEGVLLLDGPARQFTLKY